LAPGTISYWALVNSAYCCTYVLGELKVLHHIFPVQDRGTLNSDWDYNLLAERPIPKVKSDTKPESEDTLLDSTRAPVAASAVDDKKPKRKQASAVDGNCRCVLM
jgi:hypothetical protein